MLRNDNNDEMYYDKNNYVKLFYLIIKKDVTTELPTHRAYLIFIFILCTFKKNRQV